MIMMVSLPAIIRHLTVMMVSVISRVITNPTSILNYRVLLDVAVAALAMTYGAIGAVKLFLTYAAQALTLLPPGQTIPMTVPTRTD